MNTQTNQANPRLTQDFFNQHALDVAKDLIGKEIRFNGKSGIITETEAYRGEDDPASQAHRSHTARNDPMFCAPGIAYVYFTYGMHNMLNFITEPDGIPSAVLIRGVITKDGLFDGPAKLTKYFCITRDNNRADIINDENFGVFDVGVKMKFETTPRIGISKGQDLMWRFVVKKNDINLTNHN